MLFVSKSVDLLEVLDHLCSVNSSLTIIYERLIFLFVDLSHDFFLRFHTWDEINSVKFVFFTRHLGVLDLSFLRTSTINIFWHFELFGWSGLFLGPDCGIVDLGLLLLRVHAVEEIAHVIASAKLFPEILIYWILAEVMFIVDLVLIKLRIFHCC
jgi:hypothetical protein